MQWTREHFIPKDARKEENDMEQLERLHEAAHEAITEIVVNDDRSDGVTMLKDVLRALEGAGFPTDADPWQSIAYHTDDMAHTPQWVDVDDLADALRQARTLALGRMGKLYCDACRTFYEPKRRPHCHMVYHPVGWQAGEHGEWLCPTC